MELVKVYSADSELDAELIKSILESEGINAMITSETYGRLLGGLIPSSTFGYIRVLVRPEDAERAREIISETRIEPDMTEEEGERQDEKNE